MHSSSTSPKAQAPRDSRIRAYMAEHGCPYAKAKEDLQVIEGRTMVSMRNQIAPNRRKRRRPG